MRHGLLMDSNRFVQVIHLPDVAEIGSEEPLPRLLRCRGNSGESGGVHCTGPLVVLGWPRSKILLLSRTCKTVAQAGPETIEVFGQLR
jgi:hypothetical protein